MRKYKRPSAAATAGKVRGKGKTVSSSSTRAVSSSKSANRINNNIREDGGGGGAYNETAKTTTTTTATRNKPNYPNVGKSSSIIDMRSSSATTTTRLPIATVRTYNNKAEGKSGIEPPAWNWNMMTTKETNNNNNKKRGQKNNNWNPQLEVAGRRRP